MKKKYKKNGFSLVEILVVIMFIGVGLVGVLSFFSSSLRSNADAKNELIAAGLAQEGVELARNIRDYNILSPDILRPNWWSYLYWWEGPGPPPPAHDVSWCPHIDYRSLETHNCVASTDDIYYVSGRYRHRKLIPLDPVSSKTAFQRKLSIVRNGDLTAGGFLEVTCTVTWNDRTTTATDRLYENSY
jgi:prepilin-type N-terminal cleavage/methylation domain-containing protein